jgi:predicted dinucleotide-binding enzyme
MTAALAGAGNSSHAFATRLRAAAKAVLTAKKRLGLLNCPAT